MQRKLSNELRNAYIEYCLKVRAIFENYRKERDDLKEFLAKQRAGLLAMQDNKKRVLISKKSEGVETRGRKKKERK